MNFDAALRRTQSPPNVTAAAGARNSTPDPSRLVVLRILIVRSVPGCPKGAMTIADRVGITARVRITLARELPTWPLCQADPREPWPPLLGPTGSRSQESSSPTGGRAPTL